MRIFYNVFKKELNLLFKGTGFIWLSFVFSVGLFTLFRFTLPAHNMNIETAISILWGAYVISCLFSLLAAQEWEWEWFAYRAVRLSGTAGHTVFLSKSIATFVALSLLWIFILTVWFVFFGGSFLPADASIPVILIKYFSKFLVVGILATLGITFLGQLAAVLALHSRFRHILLLILFFPMSLPVLIAGSSFCRLAWQEAEWSEMSGLLNLLAAFLFIYAAAGIALYDYLWEE
ncbi:MAG: heme exporter protein CcmB [Spirochaetia bacterium]|nr:heme exporter protein CcmB [Spirochaetia bacterium]